MFGFLHVLGWGVYVCDFLSARGMLSVIYLECFIGANGVHACT